MTSIENPTAAPSPLRRRASPTMTTRALAVYLFLGLAALAWVTLFLGTVVVEYWMYKDGGAAGGSAIGGGMIVREPLVNFRQQGGRLGLNQGVLPHDHGGSGHGGDGHGDGPSSESPPRLGSYAEASEAARDEFASRYGGKDAAAGLLSGGIIAFADKKQAHGDDKRAASEHTAAIRHTAERILRARANDQPFVMAFGGYSVTVGRGNYLNQSFPFVAERILKEPLRRIGVDLVVRNAAIGGIPSFPYGWCMRNFLGADADVVSWDFAMNEGNGAEGLETYVRHSLTLPKSPMFILLDAKRPRINLLQNYVDAGSLPDPIAVRRDKDGWFKPYVDTKEEDRPLGFQRWNDWGGPRGAPGQSPWHPKMKEHEVIGWLVAMHLLDAVDVAADIMEGSDGDDWRRAFVGANNGVRTSALYKPMHLREELQASSLSSLLYGFPRDASGDHWDMNRIHCRASFQHNLEGLLSEVVVSGMAPDGDDVLTSKDDDAWTAGWVMEVGKVERDTKKKLLRYGGLGYIDMKTALYGVPASGKLRLWLPLEGPIQNLESADQWVKALVVCEVNEKRGDKECNMEKDMTYVVGGEEVSGVTKVTASGTAYLQKPVCVNVGIPPGASLRRWKDVRRDSSPDQASLSGIVDNTVGLCVDIFVTGLDVTRENGACSISHVVWEEKREIPAQK